MHMSNENSRPRLPRQPIPHPISYYFEAERPSTVGERVFERILSAVIFVIAGAVLWMTVGLMKAAEQPRVPLVPVTVPTSVGACQQ
jgi:hypothetical protein